MPNRIESDSIIRDRQDKLQDSTDQSNAEYVTQLEKSSSLMPPEKPFETEAAQDKTRPDKKKDASRNNEFVQKIKGSTNEIERIDKTNEVKLHLLTEEYQKIADKLGHESLSKKDEASLEAILGDVQERIELYKSKLQAGAMSSLSGELEMEATDGEGDGEEGADVIMDGLKDQVLMAAPGIIAGKRDEEEEEEEKADEKEIDQ
ncbi:hypothetical protein [Portibacter marinus]|uniref:hypothetical protein n=1 Tax=Portibacter marinus TaxID=2898660 RepID=UPI001F414BA8|nr:hypothetical protein [Portibacter marinus]